VQCGVPSDLVLISDLAAQTISAGAQGTGTRRKAICFDLVLFCGGLHVCALGLQFRCDREFGPIGALGF
jgi:hypothetical protein